MMANPTQSAAQPATLTDLMRVRFKSVLEAIGGALIRLGFTPNSITLLGLAGAFAGAVLLAFGYIPAGGIVILFSGALDGLDGTMARLQGKTSVFGAFLDSVSDRWSELFLFGGLIVRYALDAYPLGVLLTFAAAGGSLMVSYTKARAEGLGVSCKVGLLSRMERYLVLCPALILNIPLIGVGVVAVLGNFTALQRMWHVRAETRRLADR
jgi:CDP-diacylglycerol---glycerol-3-phosphate 3-phosphatidyltransferase